MFNEMPYFLPEFDLSAFIQTSAASCFHYWWPIEEQIKRYCFIYLLQKNLDLLEAFTALIFLCSI